MALPRSGLGLLRGWDGLRLAATAQVHGLEDTEAVARGRGGLRGLRS